MEHTKKEKKLSREEQARIEIGVTEVTADVARMLSYFFILLIFFVPLTQEIFDHLRGTGSSVIRIQQDFSMAAKGSEKRSNVPYEDTSLFSRIRKVNNSLLSQIDQTEDRLEEESFLRDIVMEWGQLALLKTLGKGNEKVYPGRDSWLFYSADVEHLIGPGFLDPEQLTKRKRAHEVWESPIQPDPVQAIADFRDQLARRQIDLIVFPVPVKPSVQPRMLSDRAAGTLEHNRSWGLFLEHLHQRDIEVFDPSQIIQQFSEEGDLYLRTDTHWRPEVMSAVAKGLASAVKQRLQLPTHPVRMKKRKKEITGIGDISAMLQLPDSYYSRETEKVIMEQIFTSGDEYWQPDRDSEILLLGDSFANIYSLSGMGWGKSGGLAEHLSNTLETGVDMILRNDSGAYATRELLAADLARGRDRLAGKKIVIWEFSERELSFGDWRLINLDVEEPGESDFFVAPYGQKRRIKGLVSSISRTPRPGSVPYKDNIITLHLVDVVDLDTGEEYGQILVYGWGMRDNLLTELANLRISDQVTLNIRDYSEVENSYSGYRRSPLQEELVELELPNWGDPIQ